VIGLAWVEASTGDDFAAKYVELGVKEVVVKAQVLSGKRGKNNGIIFCNSTASTVDACEKLFAIDIRGQQVAAILIEEKLEIAEEHYISITYNTNRQQPMIIYSRAGGVDIEDVPSEKIVRLDLDIRSDKLPESQFEWDFTEKLYTLFKNEDARVVEINPLVKTADGEWYAADAKIALDDDAFFRHKEWEVMEPRTMLGRIPTEREVAVKKIDEGEGYYRGTAGKYIEMDGDIAILFSGGGASISNMDALLAAGLKPANYTEYSGNPPREKVYQLAKIVLSKPGLRGLWIAGGVANFTNVADTFQGIVDALDEIKPKYPIVVRRAGPHEKEGMEIMEECAHRNNLTMKLFGKETSMSETAVILAQIINEEK
jgi:citryl-CoA synthetase large subunit